jgi:hypothetical protein
MAIDRLIHELVQLPCHKQRYVPVDRIREAGCVNRYSVVVIKYLSFAIWILTFEL